MRRGLGGRYHRPPHHTILAGSRSGWYAPRSATAWRSPWHRRRCRAGGAVKCCSLGEGLLEPRSPIQPAAAGPVMRPAGGGSKAHDRENLSQWPLRPGLPSMVRQDPDRASRRPRSERSNRRQRSTCSTKLQQHERYATCPQGNCRVAPTSVTPPARSTGSLQAGASGDPGVTPTAAAMHSQRNRCCTWLPRHTARNSRGHDVCKQGASGTDQIGKHYTGHRS